MSFELYWIVKLTSWGFCMGENGYIRTLNININKIIVVCVQSIVFACKSNQVFLLIKTMFLTYLLLIKNA